MVDHEIRAEGGVEEGDDAQHQEGRDDGAEHRGQDAGEAAELVAHDDGTIDRDRARGGLGMNPCLYCQQRRIFQSLSRLILKSPRE